MNLSDLVGTLMQGGMSRSSNNRIDHALGRQGLGGPGGLLEQLLGSGSSSQYTRGTGSQAGTAGGGLMDNLMNMAKQVLGNSGRGNQQATGGGLGALAGALFGDSRNTSGGGAMALLGSLAMAALKGKDSAGTVDRPLPRAELPVGVRPPDNLQEEQQLQSKAEIVLKAMINAAKADHQIDEDEMRKITGRLQQGGADTEAQEFVHGELRKPMDLEGLVQAVPDRQTAAEVYAASLFTIEVDTAAERNYLQNLAQKLGLDATVVQRIHTALGVS